MGTEKRVGRVEAAKVEHDQEMENVIERLRASKEVEQKELIGTGMEVGKDWAKQHAKCKQLSRLSDFLVTLIAEDIPDFFDSQANDSLYEVSERLFFVIEPDCDGDDTKALEFWTSVVGKDALYRTNDDDWAWGFLLGAALVWFDVRKQVKEEAHA